MWQLLTNLHNTPAHVLYIKFHCICLQVHPSEALSLSHSLYSSFCEQLPNASDPLVQVTSLSPQLAQQMAASYTNLHPFHISTWADTGFV